MLNHSVRCMYLLYSSARTPCTHPGDQKLFCKWVGCVNSVSQQWNEGN